MESDDYVPYEEKKRPRTRTVNANEVASISESVSGQERESHFQKAMATQEKRKKRRESKQNQPQLPVESQTSDVNLPQQLKEDQNRPIKNKKKKTNAQKGLQNNYLDPAVIGHMEDLREDVVDVNEVIPAQSLTPVKTDGFTSSNKLYLQCTYGFKEVNKPFGEVQKNSSNLVEDQNKNHQVNENFLPVFVALNSQNIFLLLSSLCQGLLAGLALWHCIMVYFLRHSPFSTDDFRLHYSLMAYPYHAIIYFLIAFSLLNILDKYDFGHPKKGFEYPFVIFNSTVYVIILYTIALILSLLIKRTEDKIVLEMVYNLNETWPESALHVEEEEYYNWWIMCIVRAVSVILNWFIIGIFPSECQLVTHLQEIIT